MSWWRWNAKPKPAWVHHKQAGWIALTPTEFKAVNRGEEIIPTIPETVKKLEDLDAEMLAEEKLHPLLHVGLDKPGED